MLQWPTFVEVIVKIKVVYFFETGYMVTMENAGLENDGP